MLEQLFTEKRAISNNPDFNRNIKIIGKLAGVNNLITFTHKKGNAQIKVQKQNVTGLHHIQHDVLSVRMNF